MTKLTLGPYDSHAPIIKYVGVFNYDKLYRDMAGWFGKWGYELRENTHKHKVPLPSGSEQDIKWEGWRKVNEYVRFWIDVHLHVYDLKNVEVVKDGVKRTLWWGRVMVRLDFRIDLARLL